MSYNVMGEWETGGLGISGEREPGGWKKRTSNIERSTPNVEWKKMKKQQERSYVIIGKLKSEDRGQKAKDRRQNSEGGIGYANCDETFGV